MARTATELRGLPPRSRRFALAALGAMALAAAGGAARARTDADGDAAISVWKHPDCGCCSAWIRHLQASGFKVAANDVKDTGAVRERMRMPHQYGSCHTASVQGYVIEGHVPAADIRRLLRSRPRDVIGLAVPGMPVGSPGMEMGERRDAYQVLMIMANGSSRVFQSYPAVR